MAAVAVAATESTPPAATATAIIVVVIRRIFIAYSSSYSKVIVRYAGSAERILLRLSFLWKRPQHTNSSERM